ncbi:hypothetical protein OC846_003161 [Tilletia horrida]|uniref:PPM-type phosphatase domain-containing protein n=1 Tax=Tilletia horrida TaxID=155126 RepID=A0AAN6GSN8_9BASI|nr:hypothetical protein OC846_003161 [Tilletia horrida]KAK0561639.1 hypothetical protein OC861_005722 [Tilletia horrida]
MSQLPKSGFFARAASSSSSAAARAAALRSSTANNLAKSSAGSGSSTPSPSSASSSNGLSSSPSSTASSSSSSSSNGSSSSNRRAYHHHHHHYPLPISSAAASSSAAAAASASNPLGHSVSPSASFSTSHSPASTSSTFILSTSQPSASSSALVTAPSSNSSSSYSPGSFPSGPILSHPKPSSNPRASPFPSELFLSRLNPDFDPWTTPFDWLSPNTSTSTATRIQPPVSREGSPSSSPPSSYDHRPAAAAAAPPSAANNANNAPLSGNGFGAPGGISARALSIPPQPPSFAQTIDPQFHFEHGAYGIPKRHPLSARNKRRKPASSEGSSSVGMVGGLFAAASSLVGSDSSKTAAAAAAAPTEASSTAAASEESVKAASASEVAAKKVEQPDGHASASSETQDQSRPRRPRGIRENGQIVQERLRSVQVGEDAYFLREDALGVADGVGGWASRPGADPALYSRLLMHFCSVELSRFDSLSSEELAAKDGALLRRWSQIDPVEIIHCAWHRCVRAARREGIIGSSTALVAVLRGDELRIANMGDCVLLIIRQGDLLFRSTEQQHSFNFPVQLGMMGDTVESVAEELKRRKEAKAKAEAEAAAAAKAKAAAAAAEEEEDADDEPVPDGLDYTIGGDPDVSAKDANTDASLNASANGSANGAALSSNSGSSADTSASAEAEGEESEVEWDEPRRDAGRWSVKVEPGDVIIIGSDGLVDNLFDEDILEEVLRFAPAPAPSPAEAATPAATAASSVAEGNSTDDSATLSESGEGGDASKTANGENGSSAGAPFSPFGNWLPPDFSPQLVSEALCSRAKAVSEDSRALYSPFQQRAVTEGLHYVGGKLDDISVLVAVVGAHNVGTDNEGKLFVSQTMRTQPAKPNSSEEDP